MGKSNWKDGPKMIQLYTDEELMNQPFSEWSDAPKEISPIIVNFVFISLLVGMILVAYTNLDSNANHVTQVCSNEANLARGYDNVGRILKLQLNALLFTVKKHLLASTSIQTTSEADGRSTLCIVVTSEVERTIQNEFELYKMKMLALEKDSDAMSERYYQVYQEQLHGGAATAGVRAACSLVYKTLRIDLNNVLIPRVECATTSANATDGVDARSLAIIDEVERIIQHEIKIFKINMLLLKKYSIPTTSSSSISNKQIFDEQIPNDADRIEDHYSKSYEDSTEDYHSVSSSEDYHYTSNLDVDESDDDDAIEMIYESHNPLINYPHARSDCIQEAFGVGKDLLHCSNCFCRLCDVPVSSCDSWDQHCSHC